VAREYLATLDPRLKHFHSHWAFNFDRMPQEIQERIIKATPYWTTNYTDPSEHWWGIHDLGLALYVQGSHQEAYDVIREAERTPRASDTDRFLSVNFDLMAIPVAAQVGQFDDARKRVARVQAEIERYRQWKVGRGSRYDVTGIAERLEEARSLLAAKESESQQRQAHLGTTERP
jgi:hypothetical protein